MRHPPRRTAADFHPEALRLSGQSVHGLIDRRGFLEPAGRPAAVLAALGTVGFFNRPLRG